VAPGNIRSRAIPERVGFREEGTLVRLATKATEATGASTGPPLPASRQSAEYLFGDRVRRRRAAVDPDVHREHVLD
jgi:hypothetical protein